MHLIRGIEQEKVSGTNGTVEFWRVRISPIDTK
jgi:hypothetical protein